ncbi:MAG: hypothetical protein IPM53_21960 [Anaerolineaceae bacterium]|nr:hypothetical protein [Anaerolineaceae bacterium]
MKEQEPILADELSRRITAEMQGKTQPPVSEAIQPEAELAAKLISLSNDTHPDPDFVAALGSQLARRAAQKARQQNKPAPPERPSFWQQLSQLLKEGTTMNRNKYLLGALGALVLIVAAVFILTNRGNNETEPIAVVTDSGAPAEDEGAAPTDESTEEATEVADLPPLPVLEGTQATGLGGGGGDASARPQSGGGGFEAEDAAIGIDGGFIYTDPFSGTAFTLNATLPTEPLLATVVQNKPAEAISVEQARDLASRFGFTDQMYREQYPVFEQEPGAPAYVPPVAYYLFDGSRSMTIDTWGAYYNDTSIVNDWENPIPFEQAAPIAEAFLQERGLLNFEYEVLQLWGSDVNFVRVIDGRPSSQPELTVGVSHDGQVFFVSYQVMRNAETLGRYPLITPQEAWEILQGGVVENQIPYMYIFNPDLVLAEPDIIEPDPNAEQYQFWAREYVPGEEVHLYDWPIVYLPVDGGSPRIQVRSYIIQTDDATLNALAERVGQQTHLWGQIGADGKTFELTGWEAIDEMLEPISGPGVISREGDQVLFTNSETGSVYIVPNAPADLADGLEVYLFGWSARDLGLAYPVIDWENIDKIVNIEPLPEETLPVDVPVEGEDRVFEPFTYETFTVNEVSLAYYTSYSWPTDESGEIRYEGQPTIIVQPTWKFAGETNTGELVEFFVQAIQPEFLQQ